MVNRFFRTLGILALVAAIAACARTPEQEIKAALGDMVSLLEAGKGREMLEKYMDPGMLKAIKARGIFDKGVKRVSSGPVNKEMIRRLKEAMNEIPVVDKDGKTAKFSGKGGLKMTMKKIDGRWYLSN